jgi:TorA maturation chaperone TorD
VAELSEWYERFGRDADMARSMTGLPDHLCAELAFLRCLTHKEAQAEGEKSSELVRTYRLAQERFLERHPSKWVPSFCCQVGETCVLTLYIHLARVTERLLDAELRWLTQSRAASAVDKEGEDAGDLLREDALAIFASH